MAVGVAVLFISSFFYAFGPLTLAMAATCLLMHLMLDWLNDLPWPWQGGENMDENWLSNDVAGGALILAAAAWIFVWPPVRDVWYTIDPQAEARAAISNLDSFKTEPLINSEKGRESLRNRIDQTERKCCRSRKGPLHLNRNCPPENRILLQQDQGI